MNSRNIVSIFILSFTLLGCSGLKIGGFDVGKATNIGKRLISSNDVSEKEEIQMCAQLTAILLGGAPLVNDSALQNYVNQVGNWVAEQSERKHLLCRFGVMDSEAINAFAMPGAIIAINTGLLKELKSTEELYAILSHEMAHVQKTPYALNGSSHYYPSQSSTTSRYFRSY